MNRLRLFLVPVIAIAFALNANAARQKPTRPASIGHADTGAYKGAIVMDAASGKVLFEDNADIVSPPASVTKLMTFAVVQDRIKAGAIALTTPVTTTAEESKIGGTQVYLKEGETFPVEELLFAMMIQSANDGATALARIAAGSRAGFVELMNAKAREIGMTHTTFRSPHGLPPSDRKFLNSDLTTPRDLAILGRYLLLNTDILKYTSVRRRTFGTGVRAEPMDMTNHNHLLGKVAGVDGLKTGFTQGAGFCLAATAERNGRRVIVVVMGSTDSKSRDFKVAELIDRGFAALPLDAKFNGTAAPTPATTATPPAVVAPAAKAVTNAPITTPAPVTPTAPEPSPVSPVQPASAASPVAPSADSTDSGTPAVKFELPKKTPAATK